jgi:hypothetical protein
MSVLNRIFQPISIRLALNALTIALGFTALAVGARPLMVGIDVIDIAGEPVLDNVPRGPAGIIDPLHARILVFRQGRQQAP